MHKIEMLFLAKYKALQQQSKAAMATIMADTDDRRYEISVGFMTNRPAIGHLEYTLYYDRLAAVPSPVDLLRVITPHVLDYLGGTEADWLIEAHPVNDFGQYVYTFDWKHLDNKARLCPVMRTITHRPHLHQMTIVVPS